MNYSNKETEITDIIRILHKKEGFEIAERLAKVVQKLSKEIDELDGKIYRLERRTDGMDRAR